MTEERIPVYRRSFFYERLAEMNSCSLCVTNSISANCLLSAEADLPNHCSANKSVFLVELSSRWNCSGRLSIQLLKHFKGNIVCLQNGEQCHHNHNKFDNLKSARCSFRISEKVSSVFPDDFSSCLQGWLSQLFSASITKEDRSRQGNTMSDTQPCEFESFFLEYEKERSLVPLHSDTLQPLKHLKGLPSSPKDPNMQVFSAKTLAEVAISDLVSAIPSVNALQSVPYFDLLHSNIYQHPEFSHYTTHGGGLSHFDCSREAKPDCAGSVHRVTPDQLGSPDALALWLSARLPFGISQWGTTPGTKRVANLWVELTEGEIMLEDAQPPKRTVHVASVKIKNGLGQMLIEAHQEMADGSIRLRNRPLSEKMRPGENVVAACFRGISEELGCQLGAKNRVTILPESYRWKQEERESLSYPGLLTSYVIHSMDATIKDLPATGFYTVEDEMVEQTGYTGLCSHDGVANSHSGEANSHSKVAVGVKKHFWRWVPLPS